MSLKLIAVLLNVLLMLGCAENYDDRMSSLNDKGKLLERQKELQKASFDLSKVSVARLTIDGEKREVTSLMPLNLSEFKDSLTLLTFNGKQDQLVLFTYDALLGKGYEVSLVLSDFESKKKIKFPVVDPENGKVVDRVFSLDTLIVK